MVIANFASGAETVPAASTGQAKSAHTILSATLENKRRVGKTRIILKWKDNIKTDLRWEDLD